MSEEAKIPPFRGKRRRRARPSAARRLVLREEQAILRRRRAEERALLAATRKAAREEASRLTEEAKVAAAKHSVVNFDDAKAELLRAMRPKTLDDYCRSKGINPEKVIYHPRYGIPGVPPEQSHQAVENICFAKDWPAEYGGLGAYRHLENFIRITYPEIQWNPWLERMMRSLTDADYEQRIGETRLRFVNWVGAGSCVAGHTRIYDPITGQSPTIQELCEQQKSPQVLTVGGPARAQVPFLKGVEPLYEVTLDSGERFQATAAHRVLLATGEFSTVASLKIGQCLAGYAVFPWESIWEHGPSTRAVNARSSFETARDFQCGCPVYLRSRDEQPRSGAMGDRALETLLTGVRARSGFGAHLDGVGRLQSRSRLYPSDDHLSTQGEPLLPRRCGVSIEHVHDGESASRLRDLCQRISPSWIETFQAWPTQLKDHASVGRLPAEPQSHWQATEDLILNLVASQYGMVRGAKVQAIKPVGVAPYYDLHVPVWNHYYAEGAFHHNSGKTFAAGLFASCWFMFDYWFGRARSSVTLTSTSKSIIAQRVWPVIQRCFHDARLEDGSKLKWGHLVDSKKMVQHEKGDEKHSICALAVEPGDLQGSLDKIKGRHTERMLVVIDEANSTPQAIFECIPNMLTGVRELVVLVIGNAGSRLDPHGRCCEPRHGWKSITIEDEQWETKGVEQWGVGHGVALHFDGAKSPNVIAGRTEHRHIYSFERWQQVLRMGEEYRNTLQHWSQDRGFWPPDGLQTTVFTEALVVAHDGMGKCVWIDQPRPCASLDTAFGGDDCIYTPGLLGMVRGPKMALEAGPPVLVPFDPDSTDSIDYQIARWFIARCQKEGVAPELAGLDATGTGRGVYAFVQQLWSPKVQRVEFGGAASDLPASLNDPRPCREVYANEVTSLWYSCREMLIGGQLKGLSVEAVKQFCSRLYEFLSRRYAVEPKREMKIRLGYSPDEADGIAVLGEVARRNGLKIVGVAGAPRSLNSDAAWREAEAAVASLASSDYSAANEFAPYADVN